MNKSAFLGNCTEEYIFYIEVLLADLTHWLLGDLNEILDL